MADVSVTSGSSPAKQPNMTVNPQVTDGVTQTNVSVLAVAPAQSMGLVYQTMAQSISLSMQNGVAAQGGMQQINAAIVGTAVQNIMALGKK
ncbi:MAG: RebB like protein [Oscillatoria sp. SIO1A7]|nr:RebB like protein [Oscillatoria sp. SIO1A7]